MVVEEMDKFAVFGQGAVDGMVAAHAVEEKEFDSFRKIGIFRSFNL